MAFEAFDASALTEEAAHACANRLGFRLSEGGELQFLLEGGSIDVQAAPGSGKTSLTGVKLCMLSSAWTAKRRGICVLSHTNTAKDQIRSILERDAAGRLLLSYPHFVGTIQTFVDTFLALPHLRSAGIDVRSIDDDVYAAAACRAWRNRRDLGSLRGSLTRLRNGGDLVGCACFRFEDGAVCVRPESYDWPFGPDAPSTAQYGRLKELMKADGRFRYADMYAFALLQLKEAPAVAKAIQRRFPVVIIDEMQDTSRLQQDVLSAIFSSDSTVVQRMGDENQRIYESGSEGPDESFPADGRLDLGHTRRFGSNISRVASRLTVKSPQEITAVQDAPPDHLVLILFDEATTDQVIPAFEQVVLEKVPWEIRSKYAVKAIGGRREANKGESCVGGMSNYGVSPSSTPSSGPVHSLADAVGRARAGCAQSGNTFGCWRLIIEAFHELAILNGFRIDDRRPTARGFERWLTDWREESLLRLRTLARDLVFLAEITDDSWRQAVTQIGCVLCEATGAAGLNAEATAFAAFESNALQVHPPPTAIGGGAVSVEIAVDTIHNVKGETHAATLVLECKDRTGKMRDLKEVVHLLSGEMNATRRNKPTIQRICQLAFVAATRPVACLGFAVAKEDAAPHLASLVADGWAVVDLTRAV